MATYKVIQDIEAEDKLLGPLTLRQFIYAVIVVVQAFIAFKLVAISFLFVLPFLPGIVFFGLLAAPFGQNQSSEVWLLAKIRFFLKPRRRIWDQSGMKQLVTITVPKKIEHALTNGLDQEEVRSRLKALANTIDSRGWAIKNVNTSFSSPAFAAYDAGASDRLVSPTTLPQAVPTTDIYAADDIMDGQNNPTAQALDTMLAQSTQAHRQAAVATVQSPQQQTGAQPADYWFMNQPDASAIPKGQVAFGSGQTFLPGTPQTNAAVDMGAAEQALLQRVHEQKAHSPYGHTKVIKRLGDQRSQVDDTHKQASKHPKQHDPQAEAEKAIDPKLAQLASNNDLNVSTIAHEAEKATKPLSGADGEVVISLR
jgi:hypothetical protein